MKHQIIKIEKIHEFFNTEDPFIYCAHHVNYYPEGNANLGPNVSLAGRSLGHDFSKKDGFSMYHGTVVPGFPVHPHRGFETVTIVEEGFVDHFDSEGSTGRYGNGDVQWLTTGKGCQHAEMAPLIYDDKPNTKESFQIWLNLPQKNKFVDAYYKMLWSEDIPIINLTKTTGQNVKLKLIAGSYNNIQSLDPNPNSWAADKTNKVNIIIITMAPNSTFTLPASSNTINRNLYLYKSEDHITIDETNIICQHRIKLVGNEDIEIQNGNSESQMLLLEAEPIGEPVVQYGPFVMNTKEEIIDAYNDYQLTAFGGWPWERDDPVHDRNQPRFSRYADGTEEIRR